MPRVCSSLAALLLAAGGASAQELPPPSPVDLVRGLRESGMPDLAVEYLADLAVKPPADVAAVLPLERAKCLLDLANLETDETVRAGVIADAKAEFDKFLKAAPNHPRRAEAAVALARLLTLEGKARLQLAKKHTDPAKRKAEAALARPLFDTAAKQYGTAAAGLEKLAAGGRAGSGPQDRAGPGVAPGVPRPRHQPVPAGRLVHRPAGQGSGRPVTGGAGRAEGVPNRLAGGRRPPGELDGAGVGGGRRSTCGANRRWPTTNSGG
jgi:hypothetical protein